MSMFTEEQVYEFTYLLAHLIHTNLYNVTSPNWLVDLFA